MNDNNYSGAVEILKASVPIVALLAVFLTPFLTAMYNKKQKIRDELFSQKLKAYILLYEIVYLTRIDFILRRRQVENPEFYAIYDAFPEPLRRISSDEFNKQWLFIEKKFQYEILKFNNEIMDLIDEINKQSAPYDKEKSIATYIKCDELCDNLLNNIQKNIGINKIKTI